MRKRVYVGDKNKPNWVQLWYGKNKSTNYITLEENTNSTLVGQSISVIRMLKKLALSTWKWIGWFVEIYAQYLYYQYFH